MAQTVKNYEAQWKIVDDIIQKKNLPQSALKEVRKIYAQAKTERQEAQIIKSLVYIISLQHENREESGKKAIEEVEAEIKNSTEPTRSILSSLLAGLYWQYFQNHRWQLYNRTNTVDFKKEDIATWTIEDFHKKISSLYLASVQNKNILQQQKLDSYNAILEKGNARYLRPTLYDLLSHRALDYFKNNERNIKKPAYAFEINDPKAFSAAKDFVQVNFNTRDSLSLQHKALLIYQDLIRFHLTDANPTALIDVDLDRIEFVKSSATFENKDTLYIFALDEIIAKWKRSPAVAQALYLKAAYYENLAAQYDPLKDTTNRFARIKAEEILEEVVRDSSVKGEGWVNSYNLLNEIKKEEFSFEVEKVNVPGQPFRALVKYKNTSMLHLRIVRADENIKDLLRNYGGDDKYWNSLLRLNPVRSWTQSLLNTNDLQQHAVEIKVDSLPIGEYILLASSGAGFEKGKSMLGAQLFYVSNISYVNQGSQFFVLHRESGQPLSNASVQLYASKYDYAASKYTKTKTGNYKTNKQGYFEAELNKENRNRGYHVEITHGSDHLFLDDMIYNYQTYNGDPLPKESQRRIFFFLDRSLYRPGQMVFFKGIVIEKGEEENKIIADYKSTVFLRNANYEVVDSATFTTNEFGSFNGTFNLPKHILNGTFQLADKSGGNGVSFSVEEYKRPKFYVAFDKVKESYKVGETITLRGSANAYAGNNISDAQVVYRVVRQPRFIYPWIRWRRWPPQAEAMEIAHGETTTDANGKFILSFKTIPDKQIDSSLDPVFDYTIYADITDINGETRSAENLVSAGYKSLLLKVAIPEKESLDSMKTISIRPENMNGEYQPAVITLQISSLLTEQRLIRKRYWQQPDQFLISKEEYIRHFPHDEYSNEGDYRSWQKGPVVYNKTDSSRVNGEFTLADLKLSAGYYQVEITTIDKDGKEVKDIRLIELYDAKSNKLSRPEYLWTNGSESIEPGEKTTIQIGSSANDVFLIYQKDKPKEQDEKLEFAMLNNEKKSFEYNATERDRGGYGVSHFFIKHNRFYQYADVINVPWTNKDLKIEYATFREKTLPGSEEKWKVKISGYKGGLVAAEMLASMYDASLDQFKPHNWGKPTIWPQYARLFNWQSGQNFSAVHSIEKPYSFNVYRSFTKIYDDFNFGIYSHSGDVYKMRNRRGELQEVTTAENSIGNREVMMNKTQAPAVDEAKATTIQVMELATDSSLSMPPIIETAIQIRKNLQETAFFFPDLKTDKEGNIEFSFTTPEALTRWKLQTLAHTKELAFGMAAKEMITQKEIMVVPNAPRFLRQGDRMEFSAKIVNLSEKEMTGQVELQLMDATTNKPVDGWFLNSFPNQYFTIAAKGSEVVKFPMEVPFQFASALSWRVIAKSGNFSDGEESSLPVLSNKLLVTETLPLPMRGEGTKQFSFHKLINTKSETLTHHALTVEYTSNPAWYAVQALPYLMEQSNESADEIWNRYYANALAGFILASSPRIKEIFSTWKTVDTAALQSNLQKNEELKSALLEETPWVLQAKTEEQQKKNIALLFDLVKMDAESKSSLEKLKSMQSSNGGFVWFKGGPDDRYITQLIVTGIGHLKKLKALPVAHELQLKAIAAAAVRYLDKKIKEDYDYLLKHKIDLKQQQLGYVAIQYLYMRSFFSEYPIPQATATAHAYYRKQSQQYWMKHNKYMQGMIALALHKTGDQATPKAIVKSLKETAIVSDEMGMYWKGHTFGYSWHWWHAPIETQALMIETFSDIENDTQATNDLKTWLLKNKQTNNWRTTKATADACYALLLQGPDWLANEPVVDIKLGSTTVSMGKDNNKKIQAGTGYFKHTIQAPFVNPEMGNITLSVKPAMNAPKSQQINTPSWGAVYWQYFEDMDKISSAATPLQLTKKLFIQKNGDRGPILNPVSDGTKLSIGDKIKIRIELRVDRDMEYVMMKDLRASAFEPVNVLSGYKWQGGLGYYESTKDVGTHFFFSYLRKGTYVFEYPVLVTHAGNFSNGITTIQSMYAPEFSAHSEGVRVKVE